MGRGPALIVNDLVRECAPAGRNGPKVHQRSLSYGGCRWVYARLYAAGMWRKHKKTGRPWKYETPGLRLEECQLIRSVVTPPLFRYHNSSFHSCAAVLQYEARSMPMHQHAGYDPASIPRSSRGITHKSHSFIEIRKFETPPEIPRERMQVTPMFKYIPVSA